MKLIGNRFYARFIENCNKKSQEYESVAIIKDLEKNKTYQFKFKAKKGNIKVFNVGNVKINPSKKNKLVDLILEEIVDEVKDYSPNSQPLIYLKEKKISRSYLENKGIIKREPKQMKIFN